MSTEFIEGKRDLGFRYGKKWSLKSPVQTVMEVVPTDNPIIHCWIAKKKINQNMTTTLFIFVLTNALLLAVTA